MHFLMLKNIYGGTYLVESTPAELREALEASMGLAVARTKAGEYVVAEHHLKTAETILNHLIRHHP